MEIVCNNNQPSPSPAPARGTQVCFARDVLAREDRAESEEGRKIGKQY